MTTESTYESILKIGAVPAASLRPAPGKVLVHPLDFQNEQQLKSGLVMPETVDPIRQVQGIVVSFGEPIIAFQGGAILHQFNWSDGSELEVGQRVMYTKFGGTEWKELDGTTCLLIDYNHLYCLIDENHPGTPRVMR